MTRPKLIVEQFSINCIVITCLLALGGCGGSLELHSRSQLAPLNNEESIVQSLHKIAGLSDGENAATRLRFCESTPELHECAGPAPGTNVKDMGILPASLSLPSMQLHDIRKTKNGWQATMRLRPLVNNITPWCRTGTLSIEHNEDGRIRSSFDKSYCNWLAFGNASVAFSFSVEEYNPTKRSLSGFYTLHFRGSSKADLSGYLLAKVE